MIFVIHTITNNARPFVFLSVLPLFTDFRPRNAIDCKFAIADISRRPFLASRKVVAEAVGHPIAARICFTNDSAPLGTAVQQPPTMSNCIRSRSRTIR